VKTQPKRYENIFKIIDEIKPKLILEVGTWNGEHAIEMIKYAAKHQPNGVRGIYYLGFDLFQDITDKQIELENSKKVKADYLQVKAKLDKVGCKFNLIMGNTRETLKNHPTISVDFIFMDGGHSLLTIDSDWKNTRRFCNRNTVTLLDDYYPTDITKGCKALVDHLPLKSYNLDFLEPIDEFENNFKVQMVKVTSK